MANEFIKTTIVYNEYNCFLTHIDFEDNKNINNFCIVKLLQNSAKTAYFVYSREGRIGLKGKEDLDCYVDVQLAEEIFHKIFNIKTGISYEDAKKGKECAINRYTYRSADSITEFICDNLTITDDLVFLLELIYPILLPIEDDDIISRISKKNIMRAREILFHISDIDLTVAPQDIDLIKKLTNEWYTIIPTFHSRTAKPSILIDITEKIDFLDEIEARAHIKKSNKHGLQYKYDKLNADIFMPSLAETTAITNYYYNTCSGSRPIINIYAINRHNDIGFIPNSSTKLLFHGSNNINYSGIIEKGLVIKPFGIKTHGSLFGNGIYFANAAEKSLQYIRNHSTSSKSNAKSKSNIPGIIALCAVDLGVSEIMSQPSTKEIIADSVHVKGRYSLKGEEIVPIAGIHVDISKIAEVDPSAQMVYDEFIVYSEKRVVIKYLIVIL